MTRFPNKFRVDMKDILPQGTHQLGNSLSATSGRTPRGGTARRGLALLAVASLAAAAMVSGPAAPPRDAAAIPPFPIQDLGQGADGQTNPNWAARLSGVSNTGNTYTSDGWLRLTNNRMSQATNILNNVAFPATTGFQVTFDYRQSGGMEYTGANAKYRTGDGIAMYLVDGSNSISVGADGNGLGYANGGDGGCQTPGVKGGYLGLGLDVYGNFASPEKGNYEGTHGDLPTAITLRGSGPGSCNSGPATAQYPYIDGVDADLWTGSASDTNDPATYNSDYRRVMISVQPTGSAVQVSVYMSAKVSKDKQPGAMTQLFTSDLSGVPGQVALPSTLKLGFSASTGAATDYHDIRAISVVPLTDVALTKSLSSTTPGHAGFAAGTFVPGDPISFTLTATNNGPTEIGAPPEGVARVFDDLGALPIKDVTWTCATAGGAACVDSSGSGPAVAADWSGPVGSSVTVTVNGTVADGMGSYTNTAVVPTNFTTNTIDPNSNFIQKDRGLTDTDLSNNQASATFAVTGPHFTQAKTSDKPTYSVGQPITYTVTVTNDGQAPGTADLADPVPAGVTVADVTCAGQGGAACTASHTDNAVSGTIDAPAGGSAAFTITGTTTEGPTLHNVAVVTPTTAGCDVVDCGGGPAEVTPTLVAAPGLSLTKQAVDQAGARVTDLTAGQAVTYQLTVTNSGQTPVEQVNVSEDSFTGSGSLGAVACPATTLAVGASVVCTAAYSVTAADVAAGSVTNTATAHGVEPVQGTPVDSAPATYTLTAPPQPAIRLVKTGALTPGSTGLAGDTVNFTLTATNGGNVPLTGVTIADSLPGLSPLAHTWPGAPGTLAPGQAVTATATYPLTQADVDFGSVANTGTVTGSAPDGQQVQASDTATVAVPAAPALRLTKTASQAGGAIQQLTAGQTVDYHFHVTNTGNVTLTGVTIVETAFDGAGALSPIQCPAEPLAPGESLICAATYQTVQADVEKGRVDNTAIAKATRPGSDQPVESAPASAELPFGQAPAVTLTKAGALADGATGRAGDMVTYTLAATNSGNVTLKSVAITDPLPGLSEISSTWPAAPGVLAPGQRVTATATYALTQADVDAGLVANTATVTGLDPSGHPVTAEATATVPVPAQPAIDLIKTAELADGATGVVGDVILYHYTATNIGNVRLTGTVITDPLPELTPLLYNWPGAGGVLVPGETVSATASHTVTQADIDAGAVGSPATATGTAPDGTSVQDTDQVMTPLHPGPALKLDKTGQLAEGAYWETGSVISYTFTATNVGNVTVADAVISDPREGLSALAYGPWPGDTAGTLRPGESVTATAQYALVDDDVARGSVTNIAHVAGVAPDGSPVETDSPKVVVTGPLRPAPLAVTGASVGRGALGLVALLLATGVTTFVAARRRLMAS